MELSIRKTEILILLAFLVAAEVLFTQFFPHALFLDLALIFAIYVGWNTSPAYGGFYGMVFGLTKDGLTGLPFGLNGLSKTLIGFMASYLSKQITSETLFSRVLTVFLLSLLDSAILYAILAMLNEPFREAFWLDILIQAAVTSLLGALVFRLLDGVRLPPKDFRHLDGA